MTVTRKPLIGLSVVLLIAFLLAADYAPTGKAVGDQVDLLSYYLPGRQVGVHMSTGETFQTDEAPVHGRSGFFIIKNVQGNNFEEFSYDANYIYHHRDTTWATGFSRNVKCAGTNDDAYFTLLDGSYGDPCSAYQQDASREGGAWVPRMMGVGDVHTRALTVVGFNKRTCECCRTEHTGTTTLSMKLVSVGKWREFDDVVRIAVLAGPGQGENFYVAKGYGWVGWEVHSSDPVDGPVGTAAYPTGTAAQDLTVDDACSPAILSGAVSGSVTNKQTGGTVQGATAAAAGRSALTDASGNYRIARVPVGQVTVTAAKKGYNSASVPNVVVRENEETRGINLELEPVAPPEPCTEGTGYIDAVAARDRICIAQLRHVCNEHAEYGEIRNAGGAFDALCLENRAYATWSECDVDGAAEKTGPNGITEPKGTIHTVNGRDVLCFPSSGFESWIQCSGSLFADGVAKQEGELVTDGVDTYYCCDSAWQDESCDVLKCSACGHSCFLRGKNVGICSSSLRCVPIPTYIDSQYCCVDEDCPLYNRCEEGLCTSVFGKPVRIEVTPSPAAVKLGETQQFVAKGYDRDGRELPGLAFVWSVSGGIGTVDNTGMFTASTKGAGTVDAMAQRLTGSAAVTVGSACEPLQQSECDARPAQCWWSAALIGSSSCKDCPAGCSAWNKDYERCSKKICGTKCYIPDTLFKDCKSCPASLTDCNALRTQEDCRNQACDTSNCYWAGGFSGCDPCPATTNCADYTSETACTQCSYAKTGCRWSSNVCVPVAADRSKLGIQTSFGHHDAMRFIEEAKPAVVKLVGSRQATSVLAQAKTVREKSPCSFIVGRIISASESVGAGDATAKAREWFNANQDIITASPEVRCWEGYNEPVINDKATMQWYATFEAERVRLLAGVGAKACIGTFSTGTPEFNLWSDFLPAVQAAKDNGGYLSLHEYSAPNMRCLFRESDGEGSLTGRYRKIYREYLEPAGLGIPLVITEAGIDGGGGICQKCSCSPCSGGSDCGWRSYLESTAYVNELKWYDSLLKQDSYVVGAAIFHLGLPGQTSFEIAPEVSNELKGYVGSVPARC